MDFTIVKIYEDTAVTALLTIDDEDRSVCRMQPNKGSYCRILVDLDDFKVHNINVERCIMTNFLCTSSMYLK